MSMDSLILGDPLALWAVQHSFCTRGLANAACTRAEGSLVDVEKVKVKGQVQKFIESCTVLLQYWLTQQLMSLAAFSCHYNTTQPLQY